MVVAPPFVAYASFTDAVVPAEEWEAVYASLQALKGHIQEYPGCQRFEVFVRAEAAGGLLVHCYTTWDTPSQLEAYLERGYTFERLLADLDAVEPERSLVMEKIF
jgi:putative hemolysin